MRTVGVLLILLASAWRPMSANAQQLPSAPAVSAAAKRDYLKALRADLKDTQVVRLYSGFHVLTPAQWFADRNDAGHGWCVARSDDFPAETRRFYHLRTDAKTCLSLRNSAATSPRFEPFEGYKERIICDSAESTRCEQASKRLSALASLDLTQAPNVVFEDPDMAASLRLLAAQRMMANLRRPDPAVLVDTAYFPGPAERGSCVGIAPRPARPTAR